jgi:UDP-N-acetylglucosamine--N-acetylmuramyl-(pentapeptide) pyrophosphoryl-undecaprenol N-acetylglucosamine transferase
MTMSPSKPLQVLVMAGGTGGHVFPALAVAEELRTRGARIQWLGTARGIETRLVPAANIPLHFISVEGVRGRGVMGLIKAPFLIIYAVLQSLQIIRQIKPDVVIGFGGFASGPGGLAAALTRTPLVIHEQNAVAGTTNRLLASVARRVLAAFPNAFIDRSEKDIHLVGNPVRQQIQQLDVTTTRYQGF